MAYAVRYQNLYIKYALQIITDVVSLYFIHLIRNKFTIQTS